MNFKIVLIKVIVFLIFSSSANSAETTPVMFGEELNKQADEVSEATIPWSAPAFASQNKEQDFFKIPDKMGPRVSFWIDIYTKYNTDQGLLHDSQYVNLVYGVVNFSDICPERTSHILKKEN